MIELVNANHVYMKPEEKKVVLQSLKGIYEGQKTLDLSYGTMTDFGLQILSEALKGNESVKKVDLGSNQISDIGLEYLG